MAFSRVPIITADGSFSSAGATAWNTQIFGVSDATVGGIPYFPTATSEAVSGMTWQASGAAGQGLAITAGTAASAVSALSITQTWNYATAAIQGVDWTFTDTSSHANTNALRIRGGASGTTDLLTLSKNNTLTIGSGNGTNAGWVIGYFGSSGISGIWTTSVTPSGSNFVIGCTATSTDISASSQLNLDNGLTTWLRITGGTLQTPSNAILGFCQATTVGTLDSAFTRISAGVIGVGTGAAGSVVGDLAFRNTVLDGTPDTDHTSTGPKTATFNAGESVTVMDLVYLKSDGKWWRADASVIGTAGGVLGISLETKSADAAMNVALAGSFVRDDTWTWTIGATIYMSLTTGAMTETAPSATDEVVRVCGFAISADVMYFNPSSDYITIV